MNENELDLLLHEMVGERVQEWAQENLDRPGFYICAPQSRNLQVKGILHTPASTQYRRQTFIHLQDIATSIECTLIIDYDKSLNSIIFILQNPSQKEGAPIRSYPMPAEPKEFMDIVLWGFTQFEGLTSLFEEILPIPKKMPKKDLPRFTIIAGYNIPLHFDCLSVSKTPGIPITIDIVPSVMNIIPTKPGQTYQQAERALPQSPIPQIGAREISIDYFCLAGNDIRLDPAFMRGNIKVKLLNSTIDYLEEHKNTDHLKGILNSLCFDFDEKALPSLMQEIGRTYDIKRAQDEIIHIPDQVVRSYISLYEYLLTVPYLAHQKDTIHRYIAYFKSLIGSRVRKFIFWYTSDYHRIDAPAWGAFIFFAILALLGRLGCFDDTLPFWRALFANNCELFALDARSPDAIQPVCHAQRHEKTLGHGRAQRLHPQGGVIDPF